MLIGYYKSRKHAEAIKREITAALTFSRKKKNKMNIISQAEAAICYLYYYVLHIHPIRRHQVGSAQ